MGTLKLDSGGLIVLGEVDGLVVIVADTVASRPLTPFEARLVAAELVLLADRIDVMGLLRRIDAAAARGPAGRRPDDRPEDSGACRCEPAR